MQASTPPPAPPRQHHVVTPPSPGQKVPSPAGSGAGKSPTAQSGGGPTPPKMSKQEAQLRFLLDRQQKFKEAAVTAKKHGDLNSAMSFLRQAKVICYFLSRQNMLSFQGFDQMIHASRNGLPVDITQCPMPPQLRPNSMKLSVGEKGGSPVATLGSPDDIYVNLEKDLIRQFQVNLG